LLNRKWELFIVLSVNLFFNSGIIMWTHKTETPYCVINRFSVQTNLHYKMFTRVFWQPTYFALFPLVTIQAGRKLHGLFINIVVLNVQGEHFLIHRSLKGHSPTTLPNADLCQYMYKGNFIAIDLFDTVFLCNKYFLWSETNQYSKIYIKCI